MLARSLAPPRPISCLPCSARPRNCSRDLIASLVLARLNFCDVPWSRYETPLRCSGLCWNRPPCPLSPPWYLLRSMLRLELKLRFTSTSTLPPPQLELPHAYRSEERRVGKECRSRLSM